MEKLYLCSAKNGNGTLAERLGNGLQNRVEQFDSARYLARREGFGAQASRPSLFFCRMPWLGEEAAATGLSVGSCV